MTEHDGYKEYSLCGKKLFKTQGEGKRFQRDHHPTKFDSRDVDREIENFVAAEYSYDPSHEINSNNLAVLATEFYDVGGHTECAKRLYLNLAGRYSFATFFTRLSNVYRFSPKKIKIIEHYTILDGLDCEDGNFKKKIGILFEKIRSFAPKVLFAIIHPDDAIATAVLTLVHKYTDIKIFYFCHASHLPALGYSQADIILVALSSTHYIDAKYRKIDKHCVIGMLSEKLEAVELASAETIAAVRRKMGIVDGELCTMSGAAACKFFDGENSPYFSMIGRLLKREPRLRHVVISDFSSMEMRRIHQLIGEELVGRIVFLPRTPNYEVFFQSCDLFIDSFPFSSALTMLDLMKLRVPVVVKINTKNALYSFHEYMPKHYPYSYKTVEEMESGILSLLNNPSLRANAVALNHTHYRESYDGDVVKRRYIELIEGADNLSKFYAPLDSALYSQISIKE